MLGPATIIIGDDGYGQLSIGCLDATLRLEYGQSIVFFRLEGCDEGTEMTGSGSAELGDDGSLEIEISFDNGDDALLTARRE